MPKTLRNEYDKKLTYQSLMEAHIKSRKGKGYRIENINFYLKQEEYLMYLYQELKNMTYKHGGYTVFYVVEPKVRKIEKSRYIDRIVHRWLVDNFLEPTFVPTFISSSFACLKGRGMHRAALYVQACMRKAKIKDEKVMWLVKEILYSQSREKGLEIGNYTSQMFGNIYLNEIDQFVKHKLHIKYYARYLDDSVLIVETKEQAKNALEQITKFLEENLQLKLNKKTQIFKGRQGVNFCGYKINEYRMKIRDKGKRKLKKKVKYLSREIYKGNMTSKEAKKYLAGHLGYIKYANVNNLLNKIFYKED